MELHDIYCIFVPYLETVLIKMVKKVLKLIYKI